MNEGMVMGPFVLGGSVVCDTHTLQAAVLCFAGSFVHHPSERVRRIPRRPDRHGLGSLMSRPSRAGGDNRMGKIRVSIRPPLYERLEAIAEAEGMPVQELIDHILRSFTDEYDFDDAEVDDESGDETADEDVDSDSQDVKA